MSPAACFAITTILPLVIQAPLVYCNLSPATAVLGKFHVWKVKESPGIPNRVKSQHEHVCTLAFALDIDILKPENGRHFSDCSSERISSRKNKQTKNTFVYWSQFCEDCFLMVHLAIMQHWLIGPCKCLPWDNTNATAYLSDEPVHWDMRVLFSFSRFQIDGLMQYCSNFRVTPGQ